MCVQLEDAFVCVYVCVSGGGGGFSSKTKGGLAKKFGNHCSSKWFQAGRAGVAWDMWHMK